MPWRSRRYGARARPSRMPFSTSWVPNPAGAVWAGRVVPAEVRRDARHLDGRVEGMARVPRPVALAQARWLVSANSRADTRRRRARAAWSGMGAVEDHRRLLAIPGGHHGVVAHCRLGGR